MAQAERIVYRAKLAILAERALAGLTAVPGLGYARLYPPSPVIWVVTWDGVLLGRVRRACVNRSDAGWLAVPDRAARPVGGYPDLPAVARALADVAGVDTTGGRP